MKKIDIMGPSHESPGVIVRENILTRERLLRLHHHRGWE